ncbi:GntR family transcriptional regulator [Vreelandella venusta]|uniref:GntR family transcriptional regulator n=1 Tax=Vreelandella venusta TaxID=44935 RepID=UPI003C2DD9A7
MLILLVERFARHLKSFPRLPKYKCLHDVLLKLIQEGELVEGTRLPTEQDLAQALPLSLGTVQKSLRLLVESGELYRRRRLGTFVAGAHLQREITAPAFRFLRPDGTPVRAVMIRVLKREVLRGDGAWIKVLGECKEGHIRLARQDRIDSTFDCYTEIYLCVNVASDMATLPIKELEQESILPLLQTQGYEPCIAENRISYTQLSKKAVSIISPNSSGASLGGICLETRYKDSEGRTLAWQVMHIPLNDYFLTLSTPLH